MEHPEHTKQVVDWLGYGACIWSVNVPVLKQTFSNYHTSDPANVVEPSSPLPLGLLRRKSKGPGLDSTLLDVIRGCAGCFARNGAHTDAGIEGFPIDDTNPQHDLTFGGEILQAGQIDI